MIQIGEMPDDLIRLHYLAKMEKNRETKLVEENSILSAGNTKDAEMWVKLVRRTYGDSWWIITDEDCHGEIKFSHGESDGYKCDLCPRVAFVPSVQPGAWITAS